MSLSNKEKQEAVLAALGKETRLLFITADELTIIQEGLVEKYGGNPGIRDSGLLESAAFRPLHLSNYGEDSVPKLAASLAFEIIKNHAFVDGNKRTGYMAMLIFLDKNGFDFAPDPTDALNTIRQLASGDLSEDEFANWALINSAQFQKDYQLNNQSLSNWREARTSEMHTDDPISKNKP